MKPYEVDMVTTTLGIVKPLKVTKNWEGCIEHINLNPNEEYSLKFPWGYQKTQLDELHFYPSGKINTILLSKRGQLDVATAVGMFPVWNRLEFWPNGFLKNFDPAMPVKIPTPIGPIDVFGGHNVFPNGENPVCLDDMGNITKIYTSLRAIEILSPSKTLREYIPINFWPNQNNKLLCLDFTNNCLDINNHEVENLPLDSLICFLREFQCMDTTLSYE
ncbi:hypothetical protein [Spirochaeta cellobiosiphila]|uniref:hypothetical protein n=1 Tax=Spirochaeta cellobiosiphila TaxID=504483 RepID=UPI0012EBBB7D|nr:hypothetical protein [Spirochaeta cellobiosiphila]